MRVLEVPEGHEVLVETAELLILVASKQLVGGDADHQQGAAAKAPCVQVFRLFDPEGITAAGPYPPASICRCLLRDLAEGCAELFDRARYIE